MQRSLTWLARSSWLAALLLVAAFAVACCCAGGLGDDTIDLNLGGNNGGGGNGGQNQPPVAVLVAGPASTTSKVVNYTGVAPLATLLDASGSYDPDGTIVQYDWDFDNDGVFDLMDGGPTANYTYEKGSYLAAVRVTDDGGATDTATVDINATDEANLQPPVASATASQASAGSTVANFNGTASSDPDGTIVQYDWDFDNNGTYDEVDGGATTSHDYGAFGTYTAALRVTDNDGLQDTTTVSVTLTEQTTQNVPPVASLAPTPASGDAPLDVTWSAAGSSDSDGTIVKYDWDMNNDGTFEVADGGATQAANYATAGTYTVGVKVTDNDGATDSTTADVTVNEPTVNEPPTAALVANPSSGDAPLDVTWDATGSTDSDGTIVKYDWDMNNDGTFEISDGGATRSASYLNTGTFTVGVRVTDNDGATDTATADVTVNEHVNQPPTANLVPNPASGETPLDVNWDASGSSDSDGTIAQYDWDMNNDGTFEIIDGPSSELANYTTPGTYTVGVRVTDDGGLTDSTTADVEVVEGNLPPVANIVGDWAPNDDQQTYDITWDASGSSDPDGTIVQYDWDLDDDGTFETTDGGPTQVVNVPSGGTYSAGVKVYDNGGKTDTAIGTVTITVANQPPVAILLANPDTGEAPLDVQFDASTSFDPDGTITRYDYDLDGNGSYELIDAGPTAALTYPFPGDYNAKLRVFDNSGANATDTVVIHVTSGPQPPVAIILTDPNPPRSLNSPFTVDFDGSTSFDPDGTVVQYDWDLDGDGTYEIIDGSPNQTHTYILPGGETSHDWIVSLRVTDNDSMTGEAQVRVQILPPPP